MGSNVFVGPSEATVDQHDGPANAIGTTVWSVADRGFTLVEVLVAFLIAAAAIAALVHVTTGAVMSSRVAGQYDEAVTRAQSHLAALSASPLIDSDRQGEEGDGFRWHVRVAAAAAVSTASRFRAMPDGAVTLYRITITISWQQGSRSRAVRLDSARLGPLA